MTVELTKSSISYHNKTQLEYFGGKIKKTMIPVDSYYVINHINRMINHSEIKRGDHILEVGCGMGKFTFPLLERGYDITGMDLSPYLLQHLLKENNHRFDIKLFACDILDAPEELNGKFDFILLFFTLHHFHQIDLCLKTMKRLLKPGGKICMIEPNAWCLLYYIQIWLTKGMNWAGDKGVLKMRRSIFQKAAGYAGLSHLKIIRYGALPPALANHQLGQWGEKKIEKIKPINPFLAFQYIEVQKLNHHAKIQLT